MSKLTELQEYTSYHFDVVPSQLYGALDRFAQFFIEPLCKADALDREVQAVNNEFVGEKLLQGQVVALAPLLVKDYRQQLAASAL